MARIIFESKDAMRTAVRDSAHEIEGAPAPGELFFESGIVLAIALAAGILVQLLMGGT
jgi:hypothetical protein